MLLFITIPGITSPDPSFQRTNVTRIRREYVSNSRDVSYLNPSPSFFVSSERDRNSPIFHHTSPKPRIKTGVDGRTAYASKTESYVLSINHCRPRASFVSQSFRLIRTYDRTCLSPSSSLLTTSFQTFVSPDSSGSSGQQDDCISRQHRYRRTIYRSSLPFIACLGERRGRSPSLLSVAVDFYHRFHPLGQVNDSAEDWPARDPRAADLSKSDPVFFC